jgi:hypothetical protein
MKNPKSCSGKPKAKCIIQISLQEIENIEGLRDGRKKLQCPTHSMQIVSCCTSNNRR